MVTNQFEKFEDSLSRCNWYLFPIEMQKMFNIVTANAQQTMTIRGFGNIECNRETFKVVNIQ